MNNNAENGRYSEKKAKREGDNRTRNKEEKEKKEALKEAVMKWKKENEDERGNRKAKFNKRR